MSTSVPSRERAAAGQLASPSTQPPSRWASATFWHRTIRTVSLAAIALALVLALVRGHGAAVPVALVGLAVGLVLVCQLYRGAEQRFLLTLFLAALAVRIVAAVVVHPYVVSTLVTGSRTVTYVGVMFEDDRVFDNVSWALARAWGGVIEGVDRNDGYLINNYTYVAALLYYVLGHELVAAKFFNCFLGAILPVITFSLGRELGGDRVGRWAALATAFFPSLTLWSILNLKDVLVVVLLSATMLATLRFARAPNILAAVWALVAFFLIENVRVYVFYVLGWLLPLTFFVAYRGPWRQRTAIGIPFALAVLSVVFVTNQNQWLGLRYLTERRQEALGSSREFAAETATTGIELEKVPRSRGGWEIQMINAPRVLPYVLFAPFPWRVRGARDFAVIPETLAWYTIEALAVLALVVYGRRRWRSFFLPVVYAAAMIGIATLIEGNVGTIYRHRAMLMPPAFILASIGVVWLEARWWQPRAAAPNPRQDDAPANPTCTSTLEAVG